MIQTARLKSGAITAAGVIGAAKLQEYASGVPQLSGILSNPLGGPALMALAGAMIPSGPVTKHLARGLVVKAWLDVANQYI